MTPPGTGPLAGLRVLEVANWIAVPSVGAMLADLGADVVKVEPPGGDSVRGKLRRPKGSALDTSFILANRGKRSVAADLASPGGRRVVHALVARADVFLTNLTPGRAARYGLDPPTLEGVQPRLVYATATGYGRQGPDADALAFDVTAFFARAGITALLGEPDEPPPAFRPGQGDQATALALFGAVMVALRERDRTGRFQLAETALMRVGIWSIGVDVAAALVDRHQPSRRPRDHQISPLNTRYRCADGRWLVLSAHDQDQWPAVCAALGRPELANPPYDTPRGRFEHGPELVAALDEVFATAPLARWMEVLGPTGVVMAPAATLPEVVEDPVPAAGGWWDEVETDGSRIRTVATPFTVHGTDTRARGPAPEPGAHTAEVLADWGVNTADAPAGPDPGAGPPPGGH